MRSILPLLALLLASACPAVEPDPPQEDAPIEPYDPLPLVDPMIGTGGLGGEVIGLNPGAAVPWGMVQAGPDTRHSQDGAPGFYHFGGYHHRDDQISAFSHEHANGMGTNDFGNVAILPRAGWSDAYVSDPGRAVFFSHDREEAHPGSYRVTLDDDGTDVAIAATSRGAVHRYRFSQTDEPVVILDLGHQLGSVVVSESDLAVDLQAGSVDGYQLLQGNYSSRYGGMRTWTHITVQPPPIASGTWADGEAPVPGRQEASGARVGAWLTFPPGTSEVVVRVALSHVDADGARANHQAELEGRSFDEVLSQAEASWRAILGAVRVRGGTDDQRVIFHTALYHAYLWPNVFQDVDGRYRGFDQEIHHADFTYHSNFSMWDTFRTAHPWYTLARPDTARELAQSLLRMAEDGGSVPRWAHGHGYTGGMVGTPAAQILAGIWLKGVRGWDGEAGFDACYRQASGPSEHAGRAGLDAYLEHQFMPVEAAGGSASRAIEFSWNDHALSLWAEDLGRAAQAEELRDRGTWWQNHWDPDQRFVVGRRGDGGFVPLQRPELWNEVYVEGDSWHYLWPAPYDLPGMIATEEGGDTAAFLARLRGFWASVAAEPDDLFPDDYYWHGNEPDLHYAWLGSLAGHPEESVGPVRLVLETRYDTSDAGLDGNDDAGTLSSWYLFSALGFYPVAGTVDYALGSPLFDRAEIDRPDGTLVIRAPGTGPDPVVPSVTIGGEPRVGSITHQDLVGGGELVFTYE